MNEQIRIAAGRRPIPQLDGDVDEGSIGIGVGAGAVPPRREPSESISDQIRRAANVMRGRISIDEFYEARR